MLIIQSIWAITRLQFIFPTHVLWTCYLLKNVLSCFQDPPHNLNGDGDVDKTPSFDGIDIFKDLEDLGNLADPAKDGYGFSGPYPLLQIYPGDNEPFLELKDLEVPLNSSTGAPGDFTDIGN